ncbi:hypothetical protein LDENG_00050880 [Lucifuga dentata]|nr:hypothetical protein LDENG_00050880 [Lucifuga dentata]
MRQLCVIHILGTEGHFVPRVTLTSSPRETADREKVKQTDGKKTSVPVGGVTMETRMVMQQEKEEQSSQMSHSMELSSQIKKKIFTSSDEDASYADFYPIIPGDVMSVKEILDNFPHHMTCPTLLLKCLCDLNISSTLVLWEFLKISERTILACLHQQHPF